jgi:hypothetical protein
MDSFTQQLAGSTGMNPHSETTEPERNNDSPLFASPWRVLFAQLKRELSQNSPAQEPQQ